LPVKIKDSLGKDNSVIVVAPPSNLTLPNVFDTNNWLKGIALARQKVKQVLFTFNPMVDSST
jgi:hypothetical protein